MPEPLDFTSTGRNRASSAPPPAPAKRPPPRGSSPDSRSRVIFGVVAVIAVAAGVLLFLNSRNDDSAKTKAANGSTYCLLSFQLDSAASTTGAASAPGKFDGSPESLARFVRQARPLVAEMKSVAPSKVGSDLDAIVAAADRGANNDQAALVAPAFAEAWDRLTSYRATACPAGGGDSGN